MLTDQQIHDLITCRKIIVKKNPDQGYREEKRQRRCNLILNDMPACDSTAAAFTIFIRQNTEFIENFSLGLQYQTNESSLGTITLVRYNGPHGESGRHLDGHYARPHIHRITAGELGSGSIQPPEKKREITDRYATFGQALRVFFADANITNSADHFPEMLQGRLFDGSC